tara:strand:- start:3141 stop:3791 length:651 start_codon:yes stop_codon:yes gene_type:complete
MKYKVGDRFEGQGIVGGIEIVYINHSNIKPYSIQYEDNSVKDCSIDYIDSFYTLIEENNMKYKVGDRFQDNDYDVTIEIVQCDKQEITPYLVKYSDDSSGGDVSDFVIDKYYTKINDPLNVVWDDTPAETDVDEFSSIMKSFGDMLNEKNKRYGDAALKPLSIVGKHHRLGVKVDEKLSRIKNANDLKKNDVADTIGYLFLICKDMGWEDFSDQLD